MKTLTIFLLCFGLTFCLAQTEEQPDNYEAQPGSETQPTSTDDNNSSDETNQQSGAATESSEGWDRTDYYESNKQPERVQYYSGGHRGTNIINPKDNSRTYEETSGYHNRGSDFPDLVRYYSGGYIGNNIINKEAADRVKDAYMGNPSEESGNRGSYQPE